MQDSPEQGKNSVPQESKASPVPLELGHQLYARHLGFPSASSMGPSIASRLAWFSADRLPLARNILQRWSVGEGARQGLPSLQWLGNFASARRNTTEVPIRPYRVALGSAPSAAMPASAGETYPAPASELSTSATEAAPILRSADARTVNDNATSAAKLSRFVGDVSSTRSAPTAVSLAPEGSESGAAISATDAPSSDRSVSTASVSSITIQPSLESAGSPVLRSSHKKSGKTRNVQSTILESVHHDLFRASTSGKGAALPAQGGTAPTIPSGHDVSLPAGVPAPSTELQRKVSEKEPFQVEPAVGHGSPDIKTGTDHPVRTEGQGATLRAVEPTQPTKVGPTYVGPPIFRRSLGGRPRTSLPANVFRSPEGLHDLGIPASTDGPQSTSPRVLHTVGLTENTFTEPHGEEQPGASRPLLEGHPPTVKPAPEIPDPRNDNKVETSSTNNSGVTASQVEHKEKHADRARYPLSRSKLDPGATHSELVSHVLPLRAGIEHPTGSPMSRLEGDSFVQRTSSVTPTPTGQRNRGGAAKDAGLQVPSRIHAQLSSSPESSRSAAGAHKSSKLQGPSHSGSLATEYTAARAAGPTPSTSSPEAKPALSSPPSSSSHAELVSHVLPARAGIERSPGSSVSRLEGDSFVQRTSSVTPALAGQRKRWEAAQDPGVQAPSRIHSSPESSQSSAGAYKSSEVQEPSHSGSKTESTGAGAADPTPSMSLPEGAPALSSPPSPSSQSLGRAFTHVSTNSGGRLGQRLPDATTTHQAEPRTNLTSGRIEVQPLDPHRPVTLAPLEAGINRSATGHRDKPTGESQSITHFVPKSPLGSASMKQAPQSGADGTANGTTMDAMSAAAATQAENPAIPAANSGATFAATVLRSGENGSPRTDGGTVALKLDPASDDTVLAARTRVEQSPARLRSTITLTHGPSAARQTEPSLLRPSLPIALPRFNRVSPTPALHRLASVSPSASVHGSSASMLDAANNSSPGSTFTHRAAATEQLQRAPESNLPASFPQAVRSSYPLVARATTGAMADPSSDFANCNANGNQTIQRNASRL